MHGWLAVFLLVSIYLALRGRRPRVIVRGGIPVGQNEAAPRPWFCLLMIGLIFCAVVAFCTGCSKEITQCTQWSPVAPPDLLPAPKFETPLERWRRTKTNYERANEWRSELYDETRREEPDSWAIVGPAFTSYESAKKELETIQCGKVCLPEKTP